MTSPYLLRYLLRILHFWLVGLVGLGLFFFLEINHSQVLFQGWFSLVWESGGPKVSLRSLNFFLPPLFFSDQIERKKRFLFGCGFHYK